MMPVREGVEEGGPYSARWAVDITMSPGFYQSHHGVSGVLLKPATLSSGTLHNVPLMIWQSLLFEVQSMRKIESYF